MLDDALDGPVVEPRDGNHPAADDADLASELTATVAALDLEAIAAQACPAVFLKDLAAAVDAAKYWQEPDEVDQALARVGVCHALAPLADAVAAAPANNWWSTPMDLAEQRCVCWLDIKDLTAPVTRTTEKLAAWRVSTVADEHAARERQPNPATKWTGRWWSAPCLADLASTTRPPPGSETWGPALTEDGLGLTEACCWPVMTTRTPRVYEISDATAWVELVASYPLQVTLSRRHDWWRVTGLTGDWLIPDYAAVAAEYDAVHLSVYGYLTGAGRALDVGHAHTMIAGWDPDQTYWLTNSLRPSGPAVVWTRDTSTSTEWVVTQPNSRY